MSSIPDDSGRDPTPQPEPIPHADLIRAVLDGKTVQWEEDGQWLSYKSGDDAICDLVRNPSRFGYRLKPEPIVRWLCAFPDGIVCGDDDEAFHTKEALLSRASKGKWEGYKCIRLGLDPDTLDVISAKTEAA
jgi:hypothetical protein